MEDNEQEDYATTQRLKAAIHYTVGKICEEIAEEEEVQFSLQFISALSETTYRQCTSIAGDIELFAKHGKRNTVNVDDVKLLVRKSPQLFDYLAQIAAEIQSKSKKTTKKKRGARAGGQTSFEAMDDDSNM